MPDNFIEVLFSKTSDFLLNFRNSLVVGVISTTLCLASRRSAAWSLHRMRWPVWVPHIFLAWALVFHMIPPITLAGAWFTMARTVGLDNTFAGLILAHTVAEPADGALADGRLRARRPEASSRRRRASTAPRRPCSCGTSCCRSSRPGSPRPAILTFVFSWNEFAVALNLTIQADRDRASGIAKFAQDFEIQYTQMAASAALSILPALVLLLIGQRYIVKGLTQGPSNRLLSLAFDQPKHLKDSL